MADILLVASKKKRSDLSQYFAAIQANSEHSIELAHYSCIMPIANEAWRVERTKVEQAITYHFLRKRQKHCKTAVPNVVWLLYFAWLKLLFRLNVGRFINLLRNRKPKIVGLWNPYRFNEAALNCAANVLGVQTCYFENGGMPNTTTMDFQGVNADNSLPRNPEFYLDTDWPELDKFEQSIPVREEHHKKASSLIEEPSDLPRKYIFLPLQVNYDTQIIVQSPNIGSMETYIEWIADLAKSPELSEYQLVVKAHPSDPRNYQECCAQLPNGRVCFTRENTEQLIKNSEAVVTINSSVGLEALLLNKKVIVLGKAFYDIPGLTLSCDSPQSLIKALAQIDQFEPDPLLRKRFLGYVYYNYYLPNAWKAPEAQHFAEIDRRFKQKLDEVSQQEG